MVVPVPIPKPSSLTGGGGGGIGDIINQLSGYGGNRGIGGALSDLVGGFGQSSMGNTIGQGGMEVAAAARRGMERYQQAGDRGEGLYQPYLDTGEESLQRLRDLILGGDISGFQQSPGYQFRQDEARRAIENSASARGNVVSGRTLQELQERSQNLASQEYGNYINQLQGLQGAGSQFLNPSVQMPFQVAGSYVPLDIYAEQQEAAARAAQESGGFGGLGSILGTVGNIAGAYFGVPGAGSMAQAAMGGGGGGAGGAGGAVSALSSLFG